MCIRYIRRFRKRGEFKGELSCLVSGSRDLPVDL